MSPAGTDNPMERVILIAPKLELRGSTTYSLVLARELKLRGFRVTVMAGEGSFSHELQVDKVPFIRAELCGVFWRDMLYLNHYAKLLSSLEPDLIHITHHNLASIGGHIAKKLKRPYILTVQTPVTQPIPIQREYFRGAIAISHPIRQSAVNTGMIPREMVHLIENGVAKGLTPPSRENAGLIPVVGTVSRLEKDKGIDYFIHAAKELISRKVQAHFLIMGSGPEETRIRKLVRHLDIAEHVTINLAAYSHKNLIDPIDIFVSPALSESFGIFVLQAMACGVPVVASAAGGVFSLISEMETGLIVPKRDVSVFADKIQVFLNDPPFAEKIGMNGFKHVQESYPFQRTLEKTLDLYHLAEEAPLGA